MAFTKKIILTLSLALYMICPTPAQSPGGGCVPGGDECLSPTDIDGNGLFDDCVPCADIPIDGGTSLLLAAGAAYGIRELRKKRKNKNSPTK
ncbi:MAG: hypothetical protein H7Y04_10625 [Verrucomicrobia bacterium]|nr:hypothetical protein [Cytophagales bacterium]